MSCRHHIIKVWFEDGGVDGVVCVGEGEGGRASFTYSEIIKHCSLYLPLLPPSSIFIRGDPLIKNMASQSVISLYTHYTSPPDTIITMHHQHHIIINIPPFINSFRIPSLCVIRSSSNSPLCGWDSGKGFH